MKNKIIKLLCVSLTTCLLAGCSLIDILIDSASPKTSILLEVAKVYSDYAIAYPIGRTMGSIDVSEPIIIPHKQEDAIAMDYGFVPNRFVYPDDPEEPLLGDVYGNVSNYLDVSGLNQFSETYLQVGDQLFVSFDESELDLKNRIIRANDIIVTPVSEVSKDDFSVSGFISKLANGGTVICEEGLNETWSFKGYERILSILFDDGSYADLSVYQYASNKEMEGDASNMSKDGEYSGQGFASKEYHFKMGKLILTASETKGMNNYNLEKLLEILTEIAGEPFAQNYPETYKSLEDERDQY